CPRAALQSGLWNRLPFATRTTVVGTAIADAPGVLDGSVTDAPVATGATATGGAATGDGGACPGANAATCAGLGSRRAPARAMHAASANAAARMKPYRIIDDLRCFVNQRRQAKARPRRHAKDKARQDPANPAGNPLLLGRHGNVRGAPRGRHDRH